MTGTAIPYGAIVHYGAAEGTLTLKNTELIAPVAGTADEINSASPSVIGVAAWAQTGENIDEAWKLVVTDCTIRPLEQRHLYQYDLHRTGRRGGTR